MLPMNEGLESFAAIQCCVRYYTKEYDKITSLLFCVVQSTTIRERSFFMRKKSATSQLVMMAFLIALEIILTRFCSINTPILRIGFGFLPVAMMGIMYGPLWAALGYAVGDILGMIIFPSGMFFPGFTVTALLTGLVFGFFLHGRQITWKTVLPASLVIILGLNLVLDTIWLSIMMGDAFIALLPTRIFKCAVMLPIHLILIPLVWNRIMSRIPAVQNAQ